MVELFKVVRQDTDRYARKADGGKKFLKKIPKKFA